MVPPMGWGYISTHFVPFVADQLQDAARCQMKIWITTFLITIDTLKVGLSSALD
jgi:hypothetical protein